MPADQIDDIVQEAYCRIAALRSVDHIANGRSYFFQTARNVILEQLRRARIVRIDAVTELELQNIVEDVPSPERIAAARFDLERVRSLIEELPERCRRIFELRRIHGIPQREIARMLNVSENVVEAQAVRGLRLILKSIAAGSSGPGAPTSGEESHAKSRIRGRD